jgi:Immunity protein 35
MLTFAQALDLAVCWCRIVSAQDCVILTKHTQKLPYGWVFFYDSRAYLKSGKSKDMMVGNVPFLVDRVSGEIRVLGTAKPLRSYLLRYEAELPLERLEMSLPQEP